MPTIPEKMLESLHRIEQKLENLPKAAGQYEKHYKKANFTTKEAAKYLNVSEDTVRKQVKQERIPYLKAGTKLLFPRKAIDMWLVQTARDNQTREKQLETSNLTVLSG